MEYSFISWKRPRIIFPSPQNHLYLIRFFFVLILLALPILAFGIEYLDPYESGASLFNSLKAILYLFLGFICMTSVLGLIALGLESIHKNLAKIFTVILFLSFGLALLFAAGSALFNGEYALGIILLIWSLGVFRYFYREIWFDLIDSK